MRALAATVASTLVLGSFVGLGLLADAQPAHAAAVTAPVPEGTVPEPFDEGAGRAWIAQGDPTTVKELATLGSQMVFDTTQTLGPFGAVGSQLRLNGIAFDEKSRYIYGMRLGQGQKPLAQQMVQIGKGGEYRVITLPSIAGNVWYEAAFGIERDANDDFIGDGAYYVRHNGADYIQKITGITSGTPTITPIKLSRPVASMMDLSYRDGYLWGVNNGVTRIPLFRINVTERPGEAIGHVKEYDLTSLRVVAGANDAANRIALNGNEFGAQWFLGNGDLILARNGAGGTNSVYSRIQLVAPSAAAGTSDYTFRLISSPTGPASMNNDGASYLGLPVDVGVTKSMVGDYFINATSVTYRVVVTNHSAEQSSSGHVVRDTLSSQFTTAKLTPGTPAAEYCSVKGGREVVCNGPALEPNAEIVYEFQTTLASPATLAMCLENTATVYPNEREAEADKTNNTSTTAPVCPIPPIDGYVVSKHAEVITGATAENPAATAPGGVVEYTVSVTNTNSQPERDYPNASFSDNLASVLDDAGQVDLVSGDGLLFDAPAKRITWTGDLSIGQTRTFTYRVTVKEHGQINDYLLDNFVQPGPGGQCAGECETSTPVMSYVVEKSADKTEAGAGETVNYTITATNIGTVDYPGTASFSDDLSGVLSEASYNDDAVFLPVADQVPGDAGALVFTEPATLDWSGSLAVGESKSFRYSVTVDADAEGVMTNTVSPTGDAGYCAADGACTVEVPIRGYTVTKTSDVQTAAPGDTVTYTVTVNNTGKSVLTDFLVRDTLTAVLDDAVYNNDAAADSGTVRHTAGDEFWEWSGDIPVAGTVEITYTVTLNEPASGNGVLTNVVCWTAELDVCTDNTVLVPAYTVEKSANTTTARPGETVDYSIVVTNTGQTDLTGLTLTDDFSEVLDDALFNDDAAASGGTIGSYTAGDDFLTWSGDLSLETHSIELTYSVTLAKPASGDRVLTNTVCWTDASGDPECDDHEVLVPDYEVEKTADKAAAKPGESVTYTVTVTNTGEVDLTGLVLTDTMTGVLDDAAFGSILTPHPGTAAFDPATEKLAWTVDVPRAGTAVLTYTVTVDATVTGDHSLQNVVCWTDTELLCDEVEIPVQDHTVVKTSNKTTAAPGEDVVYTITVTNTGQVDLTGLHFDDDLADVLDDADYDGRFTATRGTVSYDGMAERLAWTGDLAVAQNAVISYTVTVDKPVAGDHILANVVCWTNTALVCDTVTVPVPGYSVVKTSDKATAAPGSAVVYTITVTNTGQAELRGLSFDDDLADVLDDADYDGTFTASRGTALYDSASERLAWTGDLLVGQNAVVRYTVTVKAPNPGNHVLENVVCWTDGEVLCDTVTVLVPDYTVVKTANVSTAKPGDAVTYSVTVTNTGETTLKDLGIEDTMGGVLDDAAFTSIDSVTRGAARFDDAGEKLRWTGTLDVGQSAVITYTVTVDTVVAGDHRLTNVVCWTDGERRCTTVTVPVSDHTVSKKADKSTARPGENVTYTITVTNTGKTDLTGITFDDDMNDVLDDASFDSIITASIGTANFDEKTGMIHWTGDVRIGFTATITYTVAVDNTVTGDHSLANVICWTGTARVCEEVLVPIADIDIDKIVDTMTATDDDVVTYTITARNTGQVAYTEANPFTFTDDLSRVLDDATLDEWSISGGATYESPVLNWSGALAVGASHTVSYSVRVNAIAESAGDKTLANAVVTPFGPCVAGSDNPRCSTEVLLQRLALTKTADTVDAKPGDVVGYTITAQNIGSADLPDAAFSDDLSDVLTYADYNRDADNGASYTKPVLSWTGALAAGASTTVNFTVTVKKAASGIMANTVNGPPISNCAPGSSDADCTVDVSVPSAAAPVTPPLASTGVQAGAGLLLALLALAAGSALVGIRRRSRNHTL